MMRCILFICLYVLPVFAGWNERFDRNTQQLVEQMPCFQGKYQKYCKDFLHLRKHLTQDMVLRQQLQLIGDDQRMVLPRLKEGIVIKKRSGNGIHELFAWEMSYVLGEFECIVPSFPIEMGGKVVIVQKMEPFSVSMGRVAYAWPKEIDIVSVEEYWKAHIQAYLLGLCDLVGQNIGVNIKGHIRFFDMESSFHYQNTPYRTERSFKPGFLAQSLEWPQYRKPLDAKAAESLRRFILRLDGVEERIAIYHQIRSSCISLSHLQERLQRVRQFVIEEGKTFCEFYGALFPKMAPGLDELSSLMSEILNKQVDHGSALVAVCRWLDRYNVSRDKKQQIDDWITRYID